MSLEQLLAWIPSGSPDIALARQVDFERLPSHVAIIMDGNGRWAAKRHLPRVDGHQAGIEAVRATVETSARHGMLWYEFDISWITLKILKSVGLVWGIRLVKPEVLAREQNAAELAA